MLLRPLSWIIESQIGGGSSSRSARESFAAKANIQNREYPPYRRKGRDLWLSGVDSDIGNEGFDQASSNGNPRLYVYICLNRQLQRNVPPTRDVCWRSVHVQYNTLFISNFRTCYMNLMGWCDYHGYWIWHACWKWAQAIGCIDSEVAWHMRLGVYVAKACTFTKKLPKSSNRLRRWVNELKWSSMASELATAYAKKLDNKNLWGDQRESTISET
jgi:hypothetical protein